MYLVSAKLEFAVEIPSRFSRAFGPTARPDTWLFNFVVVSDITQSPGEQVNLI